MSLLDNIKNAAAGVVGSGRTPPPAGLAEMAGVASSKPEPLAQKEASPADKPAMRVTSATRIPMSLPKQQLEVATIPGYQCQWFADRPGRISRAIAGGYEWVTPEEVSINNFGLAADLLKDGNTDLGSRISIHGGVAEDGSSQRLYLMKIRQEWYDEDQKVTADRNEQVAASLRGGKVGAGDPKGGENPMDAGLRYVKGGKNLFTRK